MQVARIGGLVQPGWDSPQAVVGIVIIPTGIGFTIPVAKIGRKVCSSREHTALSEKPFLCQCIYI